MTLETRIPAPIWKRITAGLIDYLFIWFVLWMPVKLLLFGDVDSEIEFTRSAIGAYSFHLRVLGLWLFPFCLRDMFAGRGLGKWIAAIRVVDAADLTSTRFMSRARSS